MHFRRGFLLTVLRRHSLGDRTTSLSLSRTFAKNHNPGSMWSDPVIEAEAIIVHESFWRQCSCHRGSAAARICRGLPEDFCSARFSISS
jgi:hypothetical protein